MRPGEDTKDVLRSLCLDESADAIAKKTLAAFGRLAKDGCSNFAFWLNWELCEKTEAEIHRHYPRLRTYSQTCHGRRYIVPEDEILFGALRSSGCDEDVLRKVIKSGMVEHLCLPSGWVKGLCKEAVAKPKVMQLLDMAAEGHETLWFYEEAVMQDELGKGVSQYATYRFDNDSLLAVRK